MQLTSGSIFVVYLKAAAVEFGLIIAIIVTLARIKKVRVNYGLAIPVALAVALALALLDMSMQ